MKSDSYRVIGVMSGTSLDGIDLCLAEFDFDGAWHFRIIHAETRPYSIEWAKTLKEIAQKAKGEVEKIDLDYTIYLGIQISDFINANNLKNIDTICSHGHTVFHQPENNVTFQIGNLPNLAKDVGCKVVCDFRIQDVQLGGQGAPLVPIGDKHLFHKFELCLNLGGFANLSFDRDGVRIAYDICPVNIVLNHYANTLGFNYDNDGQLAKSGNLNSELLNKLNGLVFYSQPAPKSLGIEWVNDEIFPLISELRIDIKDILRTFTEHAAIQIADQVNHLERGSVLVSGGGAYNGFLIERIMSHTIHNVVIPSRMIIDFKEALIFGFLGVLKLRNEINCLSSVTGASQDHSTGNIFVP